MTPRLGRCLEDIRRICYIEGVRRDDVIARLKEAEPGLRARGIRRAAVFGSVARGKERSDSDIDILVEIDPNVPLSVFEYAGLKEFVAGFFDGPVDVIAEDGLKPFVRPSVSADAIYAF